jgi:hypothetical protein
MRCNTGHNRQLHEAFDAVKRMRVERVDRTPFVYVALVQAAQRCGAVDCSMLQHGRERNIVGCAT